MTYLHEALAEKVTEWRTENYSCQDFPSIREILEYATDNSNDGGYRNLRSAQFGDAPVTTEGRKAVALKRWQELNPEVLHYQVIFADDSLADNALDETRIFIAGA